MNVPFVAPEVDRSSAFLKTPSESISYGTFLSLAADFSDGLERHVGIIQARNSPASVLAYFGFLRAGVVPMFLDSDLTTNQLDQLVAHYRPRYIYGDEALPLPGYRVKKTFMGHALSEAEDVEPVVVNPDLAVLQLTSGSTGSPKAVRLSFQNIQSVSESIGRYMNLDSSRVFYAHLPFHYVYGLSIVHVAATHGASLFFPESSFVQRDFWEQGKRFGVTDFSGVPFHYETLDKLRFSAEIYSFLKCATQAGGKLAPELVRKFFELFAATDVHFFVMYGQAEASPRMSFLGPVAKKTQFDSVGRPVDIGRFEISDSDDGVGEVRYHGQNVALGYATCREDLAKGDDFCGVLSTGDVGYLGSDGHLYLRGRVKRMVKIVGESVYLEEVEALLREKFGNLAVIGREDQLVVVVPSDFEPTKNRVQSELPWIRPRHIRLHQVAKIPIKASGKIDYSELSRGLWI